jgi:hypothetical protein
MANTTIQILRSYANTAPTILSDGELAYSFLSNTFFIGSQNTEIVKVGGYYYVKIIDDATSNLSANTLVLRDEQGTANVILNFVDGGNF